MRILLCSATSLEIRPVLDKIMQMPPRHSVEPFVTGVGILTACYHLTNRLCKNDIDLVILAGIGGTFLADEPSGKVYLVQEDLVADLGVEENNEWKDLFDLRLQENSDYPFSGGILVNEKSWNQLLLPVARGCTVNEISTRPTRIQQYVKKYAPVIESMEGAAIHYVCLQKSIPFIHIRAVSNFIGERDKNKWSIPLAVRNLNEELERILSIV